jgi:putative DNA methylase
MTDDRDCRLIEDYLPIAAISAEASREKNIRKGHISTLHLWWARRPLVACRAAVYGALVPASRFAPKNGPSENRASLMRANAAKFVERLCRYPGSPSTIAEAERHVLEAHADRLTQQTGTRVTVEDIKEGRAPRPKVLDMFAGGGAIPLEALRLGCDAFALDLNPVAHIIELCTLVYPQRYGKRDKNAKGAARDGTWAGLAEEVRHWGDWVLKKAKAEIGGLYPLIPDPAFKGKRGAKRTRLFPGSDDTPTGYLVPVAYLWTRTVTCKNPTCRATVPLVRQTWLCKKPRQLVALRTVLPPGKKQVRFEVVKAASQKGFGFDPSAGSTGGNATCRFCGTVADNDYIKAEGQAGRFGRQLLAVACTRPGERGKLYLAAEDAPGAEPDEKSIRRQIDIICRGAGLTIPTEPMPKPGTLGFRVQPYGVRTWGDLFTPRQMLALLAFTATVRSAASALDEAGYEEIRKEAVLTCLAGMVDRLASFSSTQCVWLCVDGERTANTFGRQALPMVWDFSESAPFNEENASWPMALDRVVPAIESAAVGRPAVVARGTATSLPWSDASMDAVITDPPYYDNVPYADISDFFYIWLKRSLGGLHLEHFASTLTPKKAEAIAEPARYDGSKDKARQAYENMMGQSFREAHRVLKPEGELVVVYAHKTTLGWSTLVDALRRAGFAVSEAWPLDTEKAGRLRAQNSSALASSIFLAAQKRKGASRGRHDDVRRELETLVRERVAALWDQGVAGADLVIACVGAGLRAFTRYVSVEYANGEEVPAERFLGEVETMVLETIFERLSKETGAGRGANLGGVDPATRFYVLWRYTYRDAELDAGEAIIFANGTHVELDGPGGLSSGARALVEKKKDKYRLRDYTERGKDAKLGLPTEDGQRAPLVDALHRVLWLVEHKPGGLQEFLAEAQPNREQMRLVAQALAGPALKAGELPNVSSGDELAALARLTANWRSVVDEVALPLFERRG